MRPAHSGAWTRAQMPTKEAPPCHKFLTGSDKYLTRAWFHYVVQFHLRATLGRGGNPWLRPLRRHWGTSAERRGSQTSAPLPNDLSSEETRLQCGSPPHPSTSLQALKSLPLQTASPYLLRPSGRLRLNICSSLRWNDSDGAQKDLQREAGLHLRGLQRITSCNGCDVDGGRAAFVLRRKLSSVLLAVLLPSRPWLQSLECEAGGLEFQV